MTSVMGYRLLTSDRHSEFERLPRDTGRHPEGPDANSSRSIDTTATATATATAGNEPRRSHQK